MPVSKTNILTIVPYWQSDCGRAVVYVGDCRDVMAAMDPEQFHAVVTDPPYGLEFMGKQWDAPWKAKAPGFDSRTRDETARAAGRKNGGAYAHYVDSAPSSMGHDSYRYQEWFLARAEAMIRVVRPGAHLLSFGGTRMWHRMACAIEDAGFDVRDTIMWVYGNGFPKGVNISAVIDKIVGADREVVGPGTRPLSQGQFNAREAGAGGYGYGAEYDVTAPSSDAAKQWAGWNTALKPSHEPIIMARKPTVGSVAQNVLGYGCGGINVDGCRVGTTGATVERYVPNKTSTGSGIYQFNSGEAGDVSMNGDFTKLQKDGRWPANLVHDGSDEVVDLLPDGAARFFYTAKADSNDRPHGRGATTHPTVKPLDLMRYLVRLVCAPGGVVLDPFMGSGSTGCAALEEGMWFVGIEQSLEYADLAVGRLKLSLGKAPAGNKLQGGKDKVVKGVAPPPPKKVR